MRNYPDNVLVFPGGRFIATPKPRHPDIDLLIAAAARLETISEQIAGARIAIGTTAIPLPPGLLEWLDATSGQTEAWAKLIEHDALVAQGCGDVA